jgi:hypothetical protein
MLQLHALAQHVRTDEGGDLVERIDTQLHCTIDAFGDVRNFGELMRGKRDFQFLPQMGGEQISNQSDGQHEYGKAENRGLEFEAEVLQCVEYYDDGRPPRRLRSNLSCLIFSISAGFD